MSQRDGVPALPALVAPRVSIVVNNHNYARFLEQAIESAVNQSMPCQVVVIDDGSTDGSAEILARWEQRVRVERRPNGGQPAAYNAGFACTDGDIVMFLDSDDYLLPDAAASVAKAFGEGIAKVHFRLFLIDSRGEPLESTTPSILASGEVGRPLLRSGLLYASAPGSGNAYRRSVLERLFPLPVAPDDPIGADFFTIYGCALFGQVAAIDASLAAYRMHAEGAQIRSNLMFGNLSGSKAEEVRGPRRRQRFRKWIEERTGGAVLLPERLTDFSETKATYVKTLTEHGGWSRLVHGARALPPLLETLWAQHERSLALKAALSVWGIGVLALPRGLAQPLIRYAANPATRMPLRSLLSRNKERSRAA